MAVGAPIDVACHTALPWGCIFGRTVLSWASQVENCVIWSSESFQLIRIKMFNETAAASKALCEVPCLPHSPTGKPTCLVPWAAPLLHSTVARVAKPRQGQKKLSPPGPKALAMQLGSSGCWHYSEMSHQPAITCAGANGSGIPTPPLHQE